MIYHLMSCGLFFLIVGIFTSVTLIGAGQILLTVPLIYYLYEAYKKRQLKLPMSAVFLLAFVFIAFLSLCLNFDELKRPVKNFGQLKYLLVGIFLVFPLNEYFKKISTKTKTILIYSFLFSISLAGVVCLYQYFFLGLDRAKSLTDTLRYGYGMGMILPVLLSVILRKDFLPFINRKLLFGTFVIGLSGLYFSFTRGALLGLICAVPFSLYFWKKRIGFISFMISSLIVLALGGFYLFGSGEIGNRFISSKNNSSDSIRRIQWQSAYLGWSEKPWLGVGHSNFINKNRALKTKYNLPHQNYKGHSHNLFLEILVGTGILGLVLFLSWFLRWMYEVYRAGADIASVTIPLGVAMFVSGQFEVILDANNATMILLLYSLSLMKIMKLEK